MKSSLKLTLSDWLAFYGRIGISTTEKSLKEAKGFLGEFFPKTTSDRFKRTWELLHSPEAPLVSIIIPREASIPAIVDAFINRVDGMGMKAEYWKRVRDDEGIFHDRNPKQHGGYCVFLTDPLSNIKPIAGSCVYYLGICNAPSEYEYRDFYLAGASLTETLVWLLVRLDNGKGFPFPTGCIFSLGSHLEQLELAVSWNSEKNTAWLQWLVF